MNREEVENKMIQLMLLSLNVSSDVIREYMDNAILKLPGYKGSLETFLNTHNNKHILFHLYQNSAKCCQCRGKFQRGVHILEEEQFKKLYFCVGSPCQAGNCLCIFVAYSHLDLKTVDMTLIFCFLKNCCDYNMPSCICACITQLRLIRNFVCHANSLTTYTSSHLDQKIKDIVYNILQIANNVKIDGYEKNIQTQIDLIKMGIFKWETVKHAFAVDLHSLMDSGIKQIIKTIEESTKSVKVHSNNLKKDIIASHKKEISNVKQAIEKHHSKQQNETKQAFADVLKDNQTQSEHLKKEMTDLHDEQSSHLDTVYTSLSENQNSIMSTQKDHTATLSIVKQTTSEIHEQQSKSSKDLSNIRETMNVLEPSFEDLAKAGKTLKNISVNMPGDTPVVVTYEQFQKDSETQTDIENIQFELGHNTNRMIHEQDSCFQQGTVVTEAGQLAGNVAILLQNVLEIKNNQFECSDNLKEFKAFIAEMHSYKETQLKQLEEQHKEDNIEIEGLKSCVAELENAIKRQQLADLEGINKDEIGHKRDFISNIIREIIAMNAKMSLSSFLLHVPGVICLLSFVCHKWLQDKNLPSICYVDKGKTHFLTDTCRKCPHFLQKISETMDSISTEILPVLKRTENFTLLLLQKNFSRIWESFSDIIMPISKVSLKIQDHVETIEKMSNDMLLEVDKYIAEDIWMDKMTDIRRSFFEITTFFRSFGNRIRLIHSLSAEIQTNIQIKPSTDSSTNLLTDITCKQMGNLYAVVVVVNSVCESYLQMDREHLPKLVSTLEKIISSSKEKVETFDYDKVLNITTENIKTLVQKQKSALEENLNEVFRVHLNK